MNKPETMPLTDRYINLYDTHAKLIDEQSSPLLISHRGGAREHLLRHALPKYGDEDYKRFDIDGVLSQTYQFNFERKSFGVDPFCEYPCSLTTPRSACHFVLEDRVYSGEYVKTLDSVFLGSIHDFERKYPKVASQYYHTAPSLSRDTLAQLNTLLVQDAFVIYVPAGVQVPDPIQIINLSGIGEDLFSSPRILLIAEEGSRVTVLVCDHQANAHRSLSNGVVEIHAGKGSHIEYYEVEETGAETTRINCIHVQQEAESAVLLDVFAVENGTTRTNFYADLKGEGASFDLDGMCILDGDQIADYYSYINHAVGHCHSDQLIKYVVNDRALGSFAGRIYVAQDAQKTLAYQTNRNLLLSDTARMYSKPFLEIYADDVKCSHGMTTGQLDDDALFYLRQRGIPYAEARLMQTIAFMSDVLDTIRLPELRERLSNVVDRRFRGLPSGCRHGFPLL